MSELGKKVKLSIDRLKAFEPKDGEGYYLAFSGGKDSVAIKALADLAGVKYDAHYRVTSVDPPELVEFIKEKYSDVDIDKPRYKNERGAEWAGKQITMWNLIPWKLMPPTRIVRYCCAYLKETGGDGRMTVTGVRWDESRNRAENQGLVTIAGSEKSLRDNPDFRKTKKGSYMMINDNDESRRMVESCYKHRKTVINPIIDWTDEDVWEFIHAERCPYCGLYDEGLTRIGCIGCPMAGQKGREREFIRWAKYKYQYLRTFDKMLKARKDRGLMDTSWRLATATDVFNWWMEYDVLPGQFGMDEFKDFMD